MIWNDKGSRQLACSLKVILTFLALMCSFSIYAHGVDETTQQFLTQNQGVSILPFIYIGAKHMLTGYDHLLFLVGVIFFLYRAKDVLLYVSLFTLGHSVTLLWGVFNDININAYLIDAIIGFSIIYKGFDNLGGFKRLCGISAQYQTGRTNFWLVSRLWFSHQNTRI